jgi:radical SAM/Cys-rich protein
MNSFDKKLMEHGYSAPKADTVSILCVLTGNRCNLKCTHCYLESSPDKTEEMSLKTIDKLLTILEQNKQIKDLELTGGEPLLNPHFRYFVEEAYNLGKNVMIASNLTLLNEPEMRDMPDFLMKYKVKIYGSLPSYSEEDVDRQRGKGSYRKIISAIKKLNELGYGQEGSSLELEIEYNPAKATIAPDRLILEKMYRVKLMEMHGITFNNLITLTNAPLGRLRKTMSEHAYNAYISELEHNFNPDTVKNMMCRSMLTVACDEKFYDCGFLHKLNVPVKTGHSTIDSFDYEALSKREIATAPVCLICTAGNGLNCFPEE